jgi:hypothetical protein
MKRALVPAILAASAFGAGAPAAACPTVPRYELPRERPRYHLAFRVRPEQSLVRGTLAVSFAAKRDTERLVFRLWPNGPRLRRFGARLTAGPVTEGGRTLRVTRPNETTLVVLPGRTLHAGEEIHVRMPWRLRLPRARGERLSRLGRLVRLGSFFPLLAWNGSGWALDQPSTGPAETWTSPAADFDVLISAPPGSRVLASGDEVAPGHWRARGVRDFAAVVGRFRVASGVAHAPAPVKVIVGVSAGSSAPAPKRFVARAVHALDAHSGRFGPYPWRTLSLAVLPDLRGGGIEYPTLVFEGPRSLLRATSHELGHQWFYSLVGNDQARDPWLDETLATWAAGRADHVLGVFAHWPIPAGVRGELGAPMTFWDHHFSGFFAGVYAQGVRALFSLGDPRLVDCALRRYVADNAYRTATPIDLLASLQRFFPDARQKLVAYGARF